MSDVLLTPQQIDDLLESQNTTGSKIITETNKRQLLKEYKSSIIKNIQIIYYEHLKIIDNM